MEKEKTLDELIRSATETVQEKGESARQRQAEPLENIADFLSRPYNRRLRPEVICNDGFEMSVQASGLHYCSPCADTGPYTEVEIGFPSEEEELLMRYAEDPDRLTGTVYGYVPIELVDEVVQKHGGFSPAMEIEPRVYANNDLER